MRPVSTNRPRNSRPSACRCQPKASPWLVNLNGRGSASWKPTRRSSSARNHSAPRSASTYFSRACLRSARSPKSRWIVSTALRHVHDLLRRQEADDVRQAREGRLVAVAAAHAAAGGEVVAEQFAAAVGDGDEAAAVGEDVHVVQRRDGEGDLEFPRQVGLAVERINEVLVLRVVEIRAARRRSRSSGRPGCAGRQRADRLARVLAAPARPAHCGGRGRGHDVAVHVAAGRQGGKQGLVDPLDQRPQAALDHAVELDALARGDAQRVVRVARATGRRRPGIGPASARRRECGSAP